MLLIQETEERSSPQPISIADNHFPFRLTSLERFVETPHHLQPLEDFPASAERSQTLTLGRNKSDEMWGREWH